MALERLATLSAELASERDPKRLLQRATDEATALVGAQFGAFFYNTDHEQDDNYTLCALAGVERDAFSGFPLPLSTAVFAPTFEGRGVVRSADITRDPRYGRSPPHHGMPAGHPPVRSCLAVPVKSPKEGAVLGGLFFGHAEPGVFDEAAEQALCALTPIVGTALVNARLFDDLAHREAELRTSETRYRLVSEAMQEGIWYWDIASNSVQWNDRLLELMGVTREAWGGTFDDWFARLHPEDRPRLARALDAHLERREPYRVELFRLRHADGEYRWCTTAGQAEWDSDGRPLRMAGSFRDITHQKLSQDRLQESELRFGQILDSIQDVVFTKNERLEVTWANAAALRHYGMTLEQLRDSTSVPYDRIEFTRQSNADDRSVFETGMVLERTEEPHRAPSGEVRTFHTVKTPLKNSAAQVVELVGVSRDITQRKRELDAQRLLAQASAILGASIEYEQTLSNVASATVPTFADWCAVDMLDDDGAIRRLAVYHEDPSKVQLAHTLHERYPPDPDAPHGVPNVLRTGRVEFISHIPEELIRAATKDAAHLKHALELGLHSYIAAPIIVKDRPVGVITFVSAESKRQYGEHDVGFVTELARRAAVAIENASLYEQLRELANTLEQRVEERTAALRESNKELEAFSYTVSHDLRAPVRHIGGFVDLLRETTGSQLDPQAQRYLETIKGAATQMGLLIDGLLSFSRLGRTQLQKVPVDLTDLVHSVVAELRPDFADRNVEFEIADLPTVDADPTMLRLVMDNLIGNALKYTRGMDPARIRVDARNDACEVVLSVEDNGAGFDMKFVDKLFGVFHRLHGDDQFDGTGIGLATVRRIVHRHGGRTWAEGTPNQGATFYFSLPTEEST